VHESLLEVERGCTYYDMTGNRKRLLDWLTENNRSRCSLARQLDIADLTVRRWLSGENLPNGPLAARLERVTGIPATDWYEEAERQ
jgi:transcriptional regulator with XRE-family HTH domain